jgi:hypothetical protein
MFYRLRQVDFDGNAHFSSVVKINCLDNSQAMLIPNPFSDFTRLILEGINDNSELVLQIFKAESSELLSEKVFKNASEISEIILHDEFFGKAGGVYLIKIISGSSINLLKAVKIGNP